MPLTRIEENASIFFRQKYPNCTIRFTKKSDGDQLGRVAQLVLSNGINMKFYIKTHSGGLTSQNTSGAKLVNTAELLVYKVLEGLEIGCKSCFFGRSGQDLYIATLDAAANGAFKEYSYYKNAETPQKQAEVWGALTQLSSDTTLSETQKNQAEVWINSDLVAQSFVHEMCKMDLIARIMRLTDFQTNPCNYGFVKLDEGRIIVKGLDFRLTSTEPDELRFGDNYFKAFINGNGLYQYVSADKVMCYALRHREKRLRVLEARKVMMEKLSEFGNVVIQAKREVFEALREVQMTSEEGAKTQTDLDQYAEIIISNFERFMEDLKSYKDAEGNH